MAESFENALEITSLPSINTYVLLEFPANDYVRSVYFLASDFITVSHSVSRTKNPVINLGQSQLSGMSLGTKMVGGSIIKLFHGEDSMTKYIKTFVGNRFERMQSITKRDLDTMESNISFKEFSDYMRDDISPFNIHLFHTSEHIDLQPEVRTTTIIGATIINTGKVFSAESLVSEETLSFIAKNVIDNSMGTGRSQIVSNNHMTGSKLLGLRHENNVPSFAGQDAPELRRGG